MTSHAPRIALFGLFGASNFGNEASVDAFLFHLRKRLPNARVACIAPSSSTVAQDYGLDLIPIDPLPAGDFLWRVEPPALRRAATRAMQLATEFQRLGRAKAMLRGFDLMVIPGTGIFDDFGQGPMDMPWHLLRWSSAARSNAVGLYHVSVGAAEVRSRLSRAIFKRAASLATYRSFRDLASKRHIARTGFAAHGDSVFPDLAFSLPPGQLPAGRPAAWPPRCIGVGVMGYYGWNRASRTGDAIYRGYLAKITAFVSWLLDRGHSIRLLTGDADADEQPARDLRAALGAAAPEGRLLCEPIRTYRDLMRQIALTDAVVATRFHNILLALMLERPVISVGYTDKNDALMEEMGLGAYRQNIESLDTRVLIRQFTELAALPVPPIAAIRDKVEQFRSRLEQQYDRIFPAR
jgi:polysaccharide pyruvyl transferase WcaK-like protein